jgi:Na+:H+ antiporter, NhaA family
MRPTAQLKQVPRIFTRLQDFLATESASGILLLICTVLALAWANSPWASSYFALWHTEITVGTPRFGLTMDLHHWINDGLMVLFFFVVGLEIKRELLVGELSQLKQAALPVFGALGGMLAPALIYTAINMKAGTLNGWGIPVATDIAFALTILTLLGPRVPTGLKVFLVALAIVDDLGAVLVIALFYTSQLSVAALAVAAGGLALAALMNWRGESRPLPYALVGILVWIAVLLSGVHATIAGVLLAFCIPARSRIDMHAFYENCKGMLERFKLTVKGKLSDPTGVASELRLSGEQQEVIGAIEQTCEQVQPPLDRLEHSMHPWIAFVVMPLFALSNAGVIIPLNLGAALINPVSLGVMLGLVLGKQIGVTAFVWLSVRLRLAVLPEGVNWLQLYGAAWVCGVGFTMSLFIANLAFRNAPEHLDPSKLGILLASTLAGIVGYLLLRRATSSGADLAVQSLPKH